MSKEDIAPTNLIKKLILENASDLNNAKTLDALLPYFNLIEICMKYGMLPLKDIFDISFFLTKKAQYILSNMFDEMGICAGRKI